MDETTDPATVAVRPVLEHQWPALERLGQLERHDLSQFRGYTPGDDGLFEFRALSLFFSEPGRQAYLIYHGRTLAGFTLTRPLPDGATSIVAFFIVRALRRRNIGHRAAQQLLLRQAGRWAIAFQEENDGAGRFWRQVATAAVGSRWREERRPAPEPAPVAESREDTWLLLDTTPTV